jgi:hypothetical protein
VIQGKVRRRPWPHCWRNHPGLVEFLAVLRQWHTTVASMPPTDLTAKAMVDWHVAVEHTLAEEVQNIARYCEHGHRGPAAPQRGGFTDLAGHARAPSADSPAVPRRREQSPRPHSRAPFRDGLS